MKKNVQTEKAATDEAVLSADPLAVCSTPEEAAIGAKLLPVLTEKIAREADARYGQMYRTQLAEMQESNKEALAKAITEMQEIAKPLDDAELSKLLQQEYSTFTVTLPSCEKTFTIRELTGRAEKRLVQAIKTAVAPIMKAISAADWNTMAGASQMEQVTRIIGLVPEAMTTLCACVAIALDPTGDDVTITPEWVEANMGLNRIVIILTAQITACRYRDFFSLGSRLFQQSRTLSR